MNFGWPNAEIGRKIANDQLLFLALYSNTHLLRSISFSTCSCGGYFHAFTRVSFRLLNTQSVDKLNSSLTHIQQTQSLTSCRSSVFINLLYNHFLNIKQTVYSVFLYIQTNKQYTRTHTNKQCTEAHHQHT